MNNIDIRFAEDISHIRNSIGRSERTDYVTTYTEREFFEGREREERVLILRTRGCSWSYHSGCSMCGFWSDTNPNIGRNEIARQVDSFMAQFPKGEVLKIFTSGSFFDPVEVDGEIQFDIIRKVLKGYDYLIVESRPEYIGKLNGLFSEFSGRLQVAIGMESTDSDILKYSVNKNYDFEDFKKAADLLHQESVSVRAYLLLKPPYLSEEEAIRDAIKSAREIADYSDFISINPMNIQSGTLVEKLYKEGNYRPPWLWSVVEVIESLRDLKVPVVSLITGSGKRRGAHNGHRCDREFSESIRRYSETLDFSYLDKLRCECKEQWELFKRVEEKVPSTLSEVILYDQ
jgi:radical SAM enzyme (TIGR01210 family)